MNSLLVSQFGHPRGWVGRLAGWVMANRKSNLARNRWTVELLALEPADDVLELGPGPGVTLGLLVERCPNGRIVGIDHSAVMVRRSRKANRAAVRSGQLSVIQSDFTALPDLPLSFDKILAVNALQFDAMSSAAISSIAAHLKPEGRLAITFQPRGSNPSEAKALAFAAKIEQLVRAAGLVHTRIEKLELAPVCAVCVIAEWAPAADAVVKRRDAVSSVVEAQSAP